MLLQIRSFLILFGILGISSFYSEALPFIQPLHTVYQFPNTTWVESITVRSNGALLVTLVSRPELYLIDPQRRHPPILVCRFPNATALLGIDEVAPDEFAVVVGNWSIPTFSSTPGSYSIWTVTFSNKGSNHAEMRRVTPIPEANFLNGLATLDTSTGTVLVGDAGAGLVYRVSVRTGEYAVVLQDVASMGTDPTNPTHSGINGLKVHDGYAYYTNTVKTLFGRVQIDPRKGTAIGPYEILATPGAMDDFDFTPNSSSTNWVVYATGHPNNVLLRITPDGNWTTVLGAPNSTLIEGPTACKFGRTDRDGRILYIVTDGGLAHPLNGFVQDGEVIAAAVDEL
jgi:hypothetical protein